MTEPPVIELQESDQVGGEPHEILNYALKIVNRQQQGGFAVEKFEGGFFDTPEEIKDKIKHICMTLSVKFFFKST